MVRRRSCAVSNHEIRHSLSLETRFALLGMRSPKPRRRPGIQAAGNGGLIAAAFRRNVQPDNFGIADQG